MSDVNLQPPVPQAATLPKELSRQLIRWLFGTSTWPESGYTARPLQNFIFCCQSDLYIPSSHLGVKCGREPVLKERKKKNRKKRMK
jgi:hypothetical protein